MFPLALHIYQDSFRRHRNTQFCTRKPRAGAVQESRHRDDHHHSPSSRSQDMEELVANHGFGPKRVGEVCGMPNFPHNLRRSSSCSTRWPCEGTGTTGELLDGQITPKPEIASWPHLSVWHCCTAAT